MNKHTGSNFDDFLEEEGILEDVSAKAHKRLLTLQLADIMQERVAHAVGKKLHIEFA